LERHIALRQSFCPTCIWHFARSGKDVGHTLEVEENEGTEGLRTLLIV